MIELATKYQPTLPRSLRGEWKWDDRSTKLLIAGVVVIGLGALAVWQFGPEVRRYIKIKSM